MSKLQVISSQEFEAEVLKSTKPVRGPPCRILEPVLEELAAEWGADVKVAKLDVDEASEITIKYQVLSVPTTMLFKKGEVLERLVGFQPKEKINGKVMAHLEAA